MKGRTKYGAIKINGYDSKKESRRAQVLKLELQAGLITDLVEQPVFELIPKQDGERAVKYIADFRYKRDGVDTIEDVKSDITRKRSDYIIKRKLMLWVHGIKVLET